MKTIGVLANCRKPEAAEILKRLSSKAAERGLQLVTCNEAGRLLAQSVRVSNRTFAQKIDVLLALGGDGTMLKAVRALQGRDIPVLGVNIGSLGFMTSVTQDNLERAIDVLVKGNYTTSTRAIAECSLMRRGKKIGEYRALNDVAIGWGNSSRVVNLELSIDGESVTSYVCDGMIVSTPTGSTGHSLSAGGPILHPETPVFVINLICPHTLSNRPVVISDRSVVSVCVVETAKKLLLSVDGQEEQSIVAGDQLEIRRSVKGVRFIHLPGYSYFSVLRQKLHWRGSSW